MLKDPLAVACALGEYMTGPKPTVWFEAPAKAWDANLAKAGQTNLQLDSRTRMMYDPAHVFINGESYRAKGADATLMHRLADQRSLSARDLRKASASAFTLLADWHEHN